MATEEQVRNKRTENDRLREQIATVKAEQAAELSAANQDVALVRAERENQSLEAELAALMGNRVSTEVSAPPAPDTTTLAPAPTPPASGGVISTPPPVPSSPRSSASVTPAPVTPKP